MWAWLGLVVLGWVQLCGFEIWDLGSGNFGNPRQHNNADESLNMMKAIAAPPQLAIEVRGKTSRRHNVIVANKVFGRCRTFSVSLSHQDPLFLYD